MNPHVYDCCKNRGCHYDSLDLQLTQPARVGHGIPEALPICAVNDELAGVQQIQAGPRVIPRLGIPLPPIVRRVEHQVSVLLQDQAIVSVG